ncbi:RNA-binding protein [Roseitranquillus sediminis]|uniref:RNA-binding protein n=1 Tax=Roseitranquillus sediminis TaxID=2809051 RepID=UPI001D0CD598|nr:RNA-binding protein [Roseitranquillus sediminis]MBM9593767.1 RNA-binding protein [Roseitranquillus sediminis]
MSRGGRMKVRDESERSCIVTREAQPKRGLIRFVVGPDQVLVPDVLEKLPGRGIWVSAEREVLRTAMAKRQFARAARAPVEVPDDLLEQVEGVLVRRLVDGISMARKAGLAIAGFEKVKDWLAKGEARVLLQASDGSVRGKSKLWTPTGGRFFGCLTAQELGLAFGREHVIHAALAAGGLTTRIVEDAARLSGVREDGGGKSTGKDE